MLGHRSVRLHGVNGHRTDLLVPSDIVHRGGLRLLKPLRLLCDLAWYLDDETLESVFEQMLQRGTTTVGAARRAARAFAAPGRAGSVRLGRVLDARPAWLRPVDSDLELRLWRALKVEGLELDRQVTVVLDDRSIAIADLADTEIRFAIEVDHVTFHGGRLDIQADKRRDRLMTRVGWTVCRITDADVDQRLLATVDELIAVWTSVRRRSLRIA